MSITWNGVSSDTIGVIVERIPNRYVPTRRFSPQQVAGRNGNILLVDKSFPNVEQEYEVYLSAEAQGLPSVARACAEWLMGPDGYCRLEDSYDTTVYREAFLMGGYDLENILNKFGRCTITFSCKPQKYLLTGDTPIEIPAGTTTTYTGDLVQFDVITGASITSLSTTITPTQDLHGYANPWIGTDYDQQPYNFRAVSSSSVSPLGNSEMGNIVGGTVAWNQLFSSSKAVASYNKFGVTATAVSGKFAFTISGTYAYTSGDRNLYIMEQLAKDVLVSGHKYLFLQNSKYFCAYLYGAGTPSASVTGNRINVSNQGGVIISCTSSGGYRLSLHCGSNIPNNTAISETVYINGFDLTQMFGSTIADYIYSLEQANSGAGVAWFRKLFPKDYYAYDAGSLLSVKTSAHKTYKADNTLLGNYALDSSLTLRGIPKLDANNNLYYDGDGYAPDGTVTRKYGIVDLGTLNWSMISYAGVSNMMSTTFTTAPHDAGVTNIRCSKYVADNGIFSSSTIKDKTISTNYAGNSVYVYDSSYTDAATFKTAMSGVYLVYELATPTTESATAYAATQSIDPDGTEEYVDYAESQGTRDVAIPVGHYTNYANICPISGLTGLSVYRTGKNLIDPSKKVAISTTIATWYNDGTGFLLHGGQTYTLSGNISTDATYYVYFYDMGETILAYGKWTVTYTPTNDTYVYLQYWESGGAHLSDAQLQLELGSTATTYEPYNGNTYAVDWSTQAGTVYGGTVDVVTGVLTVDTANIASYNGETITEPWISSMDAYVPGGTPTTGAQVVYTLATPLTYQLTAQEVEALVGTNNVWSSSGDVSVTVTTLLGGIVTNPTPFEARPMLEVSGVGEITINGKTIQILESVSDFDIDCETMEAEDNSKIYCMDFPELSGGENEIVGDGSITALTVTPRWWTL